MIANIAMTAARGPLGLGTLPIAMCLRARKLEPRALPWLDKRGHEVSLCFTGGLPMTLHGYHRMVRLAGPALRDLAARALAEMPSLEPKKVPLVLCLPEPGRADDDRRFEEEMLSTLADVGQFPAALDRSLVIRKGHASLADALIAAKALLDGGTRAVIVGGVDSYFHPEVVRWLDAQCRLHSVESENGFIPSEAAAWLLLTRDKLPVSIVHAASADEPSVGTEEPNTAAALTALAQQAKAAIGEPGWIICDDNGERHRTNEFNLVRQRQLPYGAPRSIWPRDTGDVGAACGPLYAAIAHELWRSGAAPASSALMTLCSEGPERAVVASWTGAEAVRGGAVTNKSISLRRPRSPATRQAMLARDVLEDVLVGVKRLPRRVDRPRIVDAIEEALATLHRVVESDISDTNHLDRLARARTQVSEARRRLASHNHTDSVKLMVNRIAGVERALDVVREATIDAVVADQTSTRPAEPRARRAEMRFEVTTGAPRLFSFERRPMATGADVRAPSEYVFDADLGALPEDAEDTTLPVGSVYEPEYEEPQLPPVDAAKRLAVLGGREFAYPEMAPGAEGEVAALRRLIRDCAEEVGSLWALRHQRDHELYRWDAMKSHEARMVASLDAIVALGSACTSAEEGKRIEVDVLEEVVRYSNDGPSVDPVRGFARAFVLGNVAGDDTVRAAIVGLKQSHPATIQAQGDALSLATNPAITAAAERLLHDQDPRLIMVALDVLNARGTVGVATAAVLVEHTDGEIRARAARALGLASEREAATQLLEEMLQNEVEEDVAADAIVALLMLGSNKGIEAARALLKEELEEPEGLPELVRARMMQLLAVAGTGNDAALLAGHFHAAPGDCMALGFHGHVDHVETLLGALAPGVHYAAGPVGKRAVARALVRITGAPLQRKDRAGATSFYEIVTDYDAWRRWWDAESSRFDPQRRYRFGVPFTGLQLVDELAGPEVPVDVRRLCTLELNALLGPRTLHERDFAVAQERQLAHARASVEAGALQGRLTSGGWLQL